MKEISSVMTGEDTAEAHLIALAAWMSHYYGGVMAQSLRTVLPVKRRVNAGMGRCQAGFCSPRIMDILAEEWGVDVADITKSGGHSEVIVGLVKDRV